MLNKAHFIDVVELPFCTHNKFNQLAVILFALPYANNGDEMAMKRPNSIHLQNTFHWVIVNGQSI